MHLSRKGSGPSTVYSVAQKRSLPVENWVCGAGENVIT